MPEKSENSIQFIVFVITIQFEIEVEFLIEDMSLNFNLQIKKIPSVHSML